MGIKRGIFQSIRFESTKKKVGKRGGHFSTHGCAMDLKVVVIIKTTERISQFVDYHLQPLVHKLPSFVKDTNDFLNKLLTIGNLPADSLLVTLDVSSLYTNIPHNEGINACDHFLRTRPHNNIPTGTLCDLIRMILTMNNFFF